MKLRSAQEARNTREKITRLEAEYEQAKIRDMGSPEAKELVLMGLRRMINQMKEDIIRFERDVRTGRIKDEPMELGTR